MGTGTMREHFILGMVEFVDPSTLERELNALRTSLLADPWFKGVPLMQPREGKTALFFHAKDDLLDLQRKKNRKVEDLGT